MTPAQDRRLSQRLRKFGRAGKTLTLRALDRASDRAFTLSLRGITPAWRESIPETAWPPLGPQDRRAVADVDDPAQYFLPLGAPWRLRPVVRAESRNDVVIVLASDSRLPSLTDSPASLFIVVSVDTRPVSTSGMFPRDARVLRVTQPCAGQYLALLNSAGSLVALAETELTAAQAAALTPWTLGARLAGTPVYRVSGQEPVRPPSSFVAAPGYGGGPWGSECRRTRLDALSELAAQPATAGELTEQEVDGGPDRSQPFVNSVRESRRVLLAGHDLKFTHQIVAELERAGHEVLVDQWEGHNRHQSDRSRSLLERADVIWCEWALGNAAWYTHAAPATTRVVTRFHLQEILTDFPRHISFEGDRHMLFVGEHVRREANRHFGWTRIQSSTVFNAVSLPQRSVIGDPHKIGMVGVTPARKGLAVALDVLEELRAADPGYTLHLKGYRPTDYAWFRERSLEQSYFQQQYQRIEQSKLLRGAVHWDGFSSDLDPWYAEMGVVLSTSDFESFHYTLPDGAVRGAAPRAIAWSGSDLLYPREWLAADAAGLAALILPLRDPHLHAEAVAAADDFCRRRYRSDVVVQQFINALLGES